MHIPQKSCIGLKYRVGLYLGSIRCVNLVYFREEVKMEIAQHIVDIEPHIGQRWHNHKYMHIHYLDGVNEYHERVRVLDHHYKDDRY